MPRTAVPTTRKRTLTVRYEPSPRFLLWIVAAAASIWLLAQVWEVILIVVGALILVGTLNPFAVFLERRGFSRILAVAAVFLAVLAVLGLLLLLVVPPLLSQISALWTAAPAIQAQWADQLSRWPLTRAMAEPLRHFQPAELLAKHGDQVFAYSAASAVGLGIAGTMLALAFYLLVDPTRYLHLVFALVPRSHHVKAVTILGRLESIVGGYIRGQVITSAAISAFVLCLLWACGVAAPIPLALFAGLADVLPFVGGLLSATPATLAALAVGPRIAVAVLGAILLYQEFESRVLVPRIYGKALRLPPAAIVIALLVGGQLLGIVGALLALPVAAAIVMLLEELRVVMPGQTANDRLEKLDARATKAYEKRSASAVASEAPLIAAAVASDIASGS
jgi:putative heme transporter